jgi:hypothetical protein
MGDGIGGGLCEEKGERRGGGFAGGSIARAAMSAAVAGETLDRLPPRRRMGPSDHPAQLVSVSAQNESNIICTIS